jgi:hypothetical protein
MIRVVYYLVGFEFPAISYHKCLFSHPICVTNYGCEKIILIQIPGGRVGVVL